MNSYALNASYQKEEVRGFALLSWKAIFAGLFVSLFTYMTLMALGTGIGGVTVSGIIQNSESSSGIAIGAVVWLMISAFASLAMGSYFAARVSSFADRRLGSYQGAIVASLFFALFVYGASNTVGAISGQIGSLASTMSGAASSLAGNSQVQNLVEGSIGADMNLRSEPQVIAQGLATRLLQGNDEAAKNYLAYQTGSNRADIEQRFAQLKADFMAKAQEVGSDVAGDIATAGWVLFLTFALGMLCSVLGGFWGASVNISKPEVSEDIEVTPEFIPEHRAI